MALMYARRTVGCGPRRWELQEPRDRRNERALTRKARKRTAPRPGGAPDRGVCVGRRRGPPCTDYGVESH
eukprot:7108120-Prymnesium_polylepis.1